MVVLDISSFGRKNFLQIIDTVRPEAVIFLSVDTFAHRAFNRYCRLRGIPTLHLYCGLMRVQPVEAKKTHKVNLISQAAFVASRLTKAFTKVWPNYMKAMIVTGAPLSAWWRFLEDIYNLTTGKYIQISALDARTTHSAVYVSAEIPHAIKKYGFGEKEVTAVGNPDLMTFGLLSDTIGYGVFKESNANTDVMYIDTGLIYAGVAFNDADDFLKHLLATKHALELHGKLLIVKLHPDHYKTAFPDMLTENGIGLVQNTQFVQQLKNCAAAIVEPSTAAMIPALMGIPVLLARYGKLSQQLYGEILTSYPRSIELQDLSKINHLLSEKSQERDPAKIFFWINENVGPLPPEDMPARVASVVKKMVDGNFY